MEQRSGGLRSARLTGREGPGGRCRLHDDQVAASNGLRCRDCSSKVVSTLSTGPSVLTSMAATGLHVLT